MTQRINWFLTILLSACLIYSLADIKHPVSARQNSKKPDAQKWEYCAIYGKIGFGNGTGGTVWYFHESGTQFPNPANDGDAAKDGDSYFRTVAKLGVEGWEIVGPNTDGYLLFKRPIQ